MNPPRRPAASSSSERAVARIGEVFAQFAALPAAERAEFCRRLRPWRVAPGGPLLLQGEVCDWLAFLLRGAVRIQRDADGRTRTLGFDFEDRFVSDYVSFLTGAPSTCGIVALEDCELVRLPRADLFALYDRSPVWDRFGRLMAEHHYVRRARKEEEIRLLSPAERYLRIVRSRPYLIRRVPQYELASYLGVTPETLSRIRGRLDVGVDEVR